MKHFGCKLYLLAILSFLNSDRMNSQTKTIFLSGWEVVFNGDEDCQKFLSTQVVNEVTAMKESSAIELIFQNNKLVKTFEYEEGEKQLRALDPVEVGFPYQQLIPHTIYDIVRAEEGVSYLGGDAPDFFKIPTYDFVLPFQYLGMFSPKDPAFNWLPFDLHLAAPIYSNFQFFFMDYSNPLEPKPHHQMDLSKMNNAYEEELKADSKIIFKKSFIKTEIVDSSIDSYAFAGVPNWIQYPDITSCPKSGKTMRFLCQITSDTGIETKFTNVKSESKFIQDYFHRLNFWGDGDIFIFFEPESKMVCYLIQNT